MKHHKIQYKGLIYTSKKGGYLTRRDAQRRIHFLHKVVWEEHYGKVPTGCVIHHIDHNKLNNDLSNLQCMDAVEHRRHHMAEMKEQTITCAMCGIVKTFYSRSNKRRKFCSLRCNVAHWNRENKNRDINIELRHAQCERCNTRFSTRVSYRRYCSGRCSKAAQKKRARVRRSAAKNP